MARFNKNHQVNRLVSVVKSDLPTAVKLDMLDDIIDECNEAIASMQCGGDCEHCKVQCMYNQLVNEVFEADDAAQAS